MTGGTAQRERRQGEERQAQPTPAQQAAEAVAALMAAVPMRMHAEDGVDGAGGTGTRGEGEERTGLDQVVDATDAALTQLQEQADVVEAAVVEDPNPIPAVPASVTVELTEEAQLIATIIELEERAGAVGDERTASETDEGRLLQMLRQLQQDVQELLQQPQQAQQSQQPGQEEAVETTDADTGLHTTHATNLHDALAYLQEMYRYMEEMEGARVGTAGATGTAETQEQRELRAGAETILSNVLDALRTGAPQDRTAALQLLFQEYLQDSDQAYRTRLVELSEGLAPAVPGGSATAGVGELEAGPEEPVAVREAAQVTPEEATREVAGHLAQEGDSLVRRLSEGEGPNGTSAFAEVGERVREILQELQETHQLLRARQVIVIARVTAEEIIQQVSGVSGPIADAEEVRILLRALDAVEHGYSDTAGMQLQLARQYARARARIVEPEEEESATLQTMHPADEGRTGLDALNAIVQLSQMVHTAMQVSEVQRLMSPAPDDEGQMHTHTPMSLEAAVEQVIGEDGSRARQGQDTKGSAGMGGDLHTDAEADALMAAYEAQRARTLQEIMARGIRQTFDQLGVPQEQQEEINRMLDLAHERIAQMEIEGTLSADEETRARQIIDVLLDIVRTSATGIRVSALAQAYEYEYGLLGAGIGASADSAVGLAATYFSIETTLAGRIQLSDEQVQFLRSAQATILRGEPLTRDMIAGLDDIDATVRAAQQPVEPIEQEPPEQQLQVHAQPQRDQPPESQEEQAQQQERHQRAVRTTIARLRTEMAQADRLTVEEGNGSVQSRASVIDREIQEEESAARAAAADLMEAQDRAAQMARQAQAEHRELTQEERAEARVLEVSVRTLQRQIAAHTQRMAGLRAEEDELRRTGTCTREGRGAAHRGEDMPVLSESIEVEVPAERSGGEETGDTGSAQHRHAYDRAAILRDYRLALAAARRGDLQAAARYEERARAQMGLGHSVVQVARQEEGTRLERRVRLGADASDHVDTAGFPAFTVTGPNEERQQYDPNRRFADAHGTMISLFGVQDRLAAGRVRVQAAQQDARTIEDEYLSGVDRDGFWTDIGAGHLAQARQHARAQALVSPPGVATRMRAGMSEGEAELAYAREMALAQQEGPQRAAASMEQAAQAALRSADEAEAAFRTYIDHRSFVQTQQESDAELASELSTRFSSSDEGRRALEHARLALQRRGIQDPTGAELYAQLLREDPDMLQQALGSMEETEWWSIDPSAVSWLHDLRGTAFRAAEESIEERNEWQWAGIERLVSTARQMFEAHDQDDVELGVRRGGGGADQLARAYGAATLVAMANAFSRYLDDPEGYQRMVEGREQLWLDDTAVEYGRHEGEESGGTTGQSSHGFVYFVPEYRRVVMDVTRHEAALTMSATGFLGIFTGATFAPAPELFEARDSHGTERVYDQQERWSPEERAYYHAMMARLAIDYAIFGVIPLSETERERAIAGARRRGELLPEATVPYAVAVAHRDRAHLTAAMAAAQQFDHEYASFRQEMIGVRAYRESGLSRAGDYAWGYGAQALSYLESLPHVQPGGGSGLVGTAVDWTARYLYQRFVGRTIEEDLRRYGQQYVEQTMQRQRITPEDIFGRERGFAGYFSRLQQTVTLLNVGGLTDAEAYGQMAGLGRDAGGEIAWMAGLGQHQRSVLAGVDFATDTAAFVLLGPYGWAYCAVQGISGALERISRARGYEHIGTTQQEVGFYRALGFTERQARTAVYAEFWGGLALSVAPLASEVGSEAQLFGRLGHGLMGSGMLLGGGVLGVSSAAQMIDWERFRREHPGASPWSAVGAFASTDYLREGVTGLEYFSAGLGNIAMGPLQMLAARHFARALGTGEARIRQQAFEGGYDAQVRAIRPSLGRGALMWVLGQHADAGNAEILEEAVRAYRRLRPEEQLAVARLQMEGRPRLGTREESRPTWREGDARGQAEHVEERGEPTEPVQVTEPMTPAEELALIEGHAAVARELERRLGAGAVDEHYDLAGLDVDTGIQEIVADARSARARGRRLTETQELALRFVESPITQQIVEHVARDRMEMARQRELERIQEETRPTAVEGPAEYQARMVDQEVGSALAGRTGDRFEILRRRYEQWQGMRQSGEEESQRRQFESDHRDLAPADLALFRELDAQHITGDELQQRLARRAAEYQAVNFGYSSSAETRAQADALSREGRRQITDDIQRQLAARGGRAAVGELAEELEQVEWLAWDRVGPLARAYAEYANGRGLSREQQMIFRIGQREEEVFSRLRAQDERNEISTEAMAREFAQLALGDTEYAVELSAYGNIEAVARRMAAMGNATADLRRPGARRQPDEAGEMGRMEGTEAHAIPAGQGRPEDIGRQQLFHNSVESMVELARGVSVGSGEHASDTFVVNGIEQPRTAVEQAAQLAIAAETVVREAAANQGEISRRQIYGLLSDMGIPEEQRPSMVRQIEEMMVQDQEFYTLAVEAQSAALPDQASRTRMLEIAFGWIEETAQREAHERPAGQARQAAHDEVQIPEAVHPPAAAQEAEAQTDQGQGRDTEPGRPAALEAAQREYDDAAAEMRRLGRIMIPPGGDFADAQFVYQGMYEYGFQPAMETIETAAVAAMLARRQQGQATTDATAPGARAPIDRETVLRFLEGELQGLHNTPEAHGQERTPEQLAEMADNVVRLLQDQGFCDAALADETSSQLEIAFGRLLPAPVEERAPAVHEGEGVREPAGQQAPQEPRAQEATAQIPEALHPPAAAQEAEAQAGRAMPLLDPEALRLQVQDFLRAWREERGQVDPGQENEVQRYESATDDCQRLQEEAGGSRLTPAQIHEISMRYRVPEEVVEVLGRLTQLRAADAARRIIDLVQLDVDSEVPRQLVAHIQRMEQMERLVEHAVPLEAQEETRQRLRNAVDQEVSRILGDPDILLAETPAEMERAADAMDQLSEWATVRYDEDTGRTVSRDPDEIRRRVLYIENLAGTARGRFEELAELREAASGRDMYDLETARFDRSRRDPQLEQRLLTAIRQAREGAAGGWAHEERAVGGEEGGGAREGVGQQRGLTEAQAAECVVAVVNAMPDEMIAQIRQGRYTREQLIEMARENVQGRGRVEELVDEVLRERGIILLSNYDQAHDVWTVGLNRITRTTRSRTYERLRMDTIVPLRGEPDMFGGSDGYHIPSSSQTVARRAPWQWYVSASRRRGMVTLPYHELEHILQGVAGFDWMLFTHPEIEYWGTQTGGLEERTATARELLVEFTQGRLDYWPQLETEGGARTTNDQARRHLMVALGEVTRTHAHDTPEVRRQAYIDRLNEEIDTAYMQVTGLGRRSDGVSYGEIFEPIDQRVSLEGYDRAQVTAQLPEGSVYTGRTESDALGREYLVVTVDVDGREETIRVQRFVPPRGIDAGLVTAAAVRYYDEEIKAAVNALRRGREQEAA